MESIIILPGFHMLTAAKAKLKVCGIKREVSTNLSSQTMALDLTKPLT
jgi:hypothetical protein